MARFAVYILANGRRDHLVTGVTSTLQAHVWQQLSTGEVDRLVHYERFDEPASAVDRSDEINALDDEQRAALIDRHNPEWRDLAEGWFKPAGCE